jgi:hypothetical protein
MTSDESARLIQEYVEGSLDDSGRSRLADEVRLNPEVVEQFRMHHRLKSFLGASEGMSRQVLEEIRVLEEGPRFTEQVLKRVKRRERPGFGWFLGAAVAACLGIALLTVVLPEGGPGDVGRITRSSGWAVLRREGRDVDDLENARVRPGDRLKLGQGASLALEMPGGSVLELGAGADLVVTANGFALGGGAVAGDARGPLRFTTSQGTFEADAGTSFVLRLEDDRGQLDVLSGRGRFLSSGPVPGPAHEVGSLRQLTVQNGILREARIPEREALLLRGQEPGAGDLAVAERLRAAGFEVRSLFFDEIRPFESRGKALILLSSSTFISPSGGHRAPLAELRRAAAPLICWEPCVYFDLGLIPSGVHRVDWAARDNQTGVQIYDSAHPLAAGLSGRVHVTRVPVQISWGNIGPAAARVAVIEGDAARAAIFAFDRGMPLSEGRPAPARRVGFFLFEDSASHLTPEGWMLFDAAVRWLTGPS